MSESSNESNRRPGRFRLALIVLAAGAGTRMHSRLAKPLHAIAGLSMVEHVLAAGSAVAPDVTILVAGEQTRTIPGEIGRPDIQVVVQDPPRGTGEAVRLALEAVPDCDRCVVLYADHPLLTGEIVANLASALDQPNVKVAVLTMIAGPGSGYGRIDREDGRVTRIVERKDDVQRTEAFEANSGMMALDARWALRQLQSLAPSPTTGEWYLTDLVAQAVGDGIADGQWLVVTVSESEAMLKGVNDRVELADAELSLLDRIRRTHMYAGVTIRQPESVTIEAGVAIGADTVIEPGSILRRGSIIGERCTIGPFTVLDQARLGDDVRVVASTVESSDIGDGSDVGPYAHLRRGTVVSAGVHIGNFVETKNSHLGRGVRVGHVSYLGDAEIGANTNIGAGTITANFDGISKHPTTIGSDVFIGSDTMLVAPVMIGDGAKTGAGSVVTKNVEAGQLVMGVPARPKLPAATGDQESGDQNG